MILINVSRLLAFKFHFRPKGRMIYDFIFVDQDHFKTHKKYVVKLAGEENREVISLINDRGDGRSQIKTIRVWS